MSLCLSAFSDPVFHLVEEGIWRKAVCGGSALPHPRHRKLSSATGGLSTYLTLLNAGKTTCSGHCFANFIVGTLRCVSLTRRSEASYPRSAAGKYTWKREHPRTSRQRLQHPHRRPGSGSTVRVRHGRSRGVQAGLGGALGSPRPGLPPTREEGVRGPRQRVSPGLSASGSQAPTPHPALGARARRSGCRGPESVSPSVGAPRAEQCERPRGSKREGGGTAGSRGPGGSGTGARGLYRRLRAPQEQFCAVRAPPLLFPAAAEAAAAEAAAARPAPPPPAGAIPQRLVGGCAGRRGRGQNCALARRLRADPHSACTDAASFARIFSWFRVSRSNLLRFSGTWLLICPPPRGK